MDTLLHQLSTSSNPFAGRMRLSCKYASSTPQTVVAILADDVSKLGKCLWAAIVRDDQERWTSSC